MPKPRALYKSYLLRLWSSEVDGAAWRASLEDVRSGARQGFATFQKDIYAIRPDRGGFRKVTNAPDMSTFDGQYIVFERSTSPDSTPDLWIMRRDGSEMRLLVRGAARPSWSPRQPLILSHKLFVPLIRR